MHIYCGQKTINSARRWIYAETVFVRLCTYLLLREKVYVVIRSYFNMSISAQTGRSHILDWTHITLHIIKDIHYIIT